MTLIYPQTSKAAWCAQKLMFYVSISTIKQQGLSEKIKRRLGAPSRTGIAGCCPAALGMGVYKVVQI
jgi:hypothetical protein